MIILKCGFMGTSKTPLSLAYTIEAAAKRFGDKSQASVYGFWGRSAQSLYSIAGRFNTRAFLDYEIMVLNSDAIFIDMPDTRLSEFVADLKDMHVKNKIFCHFSCKYDSSVFGNGTANTYASVFFPYLYPPNHLADLNKSTVIVEGKGEAIGSFCEMFESIGMRCVLVNKQEKELAVLSSYFAEAFVAAITDAARRMYKISGVYDKDCFSEFINKVVSDILSADNLNNFFENKITKQNDFDIKRNMKLLKIIDFSDFRELYRNMEKHIVNNGLYDADKSEQLLSVLRRTR